MGEVYRARDTRLGRNVAVKVIPAGISADPERVQRFEQEARATAALNHANILAVYDVGRTKDCRSSSPNCSRATHYATALPLDRFPCAKGSSLAFRSPVR